MSIDFADLSFAHLCSEDQGVVKLFSSLLDEISFLEISGILCGQIKVNHLIVEK